MRFRETIIQNISITRRAGEKCRFMLFLLLLIMISAFAGILGDSVRTQAASSKEGVFCQESFFVPEASCASDAPVYKYYTSIQIQKGDTLWKISIIPNRGVRQHGRLYRRDLCPEPYLQGFHSLRAVSDNSILLHTISGVIRLFFSGRYGIIGFGECYGGYILLC